MVGSFFRAVQDFRIGVPGMELQWQADIYC